MGAEKNCVPYRESRRLCAIFTNSPTDQVNEPHQLDRSHTGNGFNLWEDQKCRHLSRVKPSRVVWSESVLIDEWLQGLPINVVGYFISRRFFVAS